MPIALTEFGPVDPTGEADSGATLLAAMTQLGAGTLLLPPGILRCDAPLPINPKIILQGDGQFATYLRANHGGNILELATDTERIATGFSLRDLTLDGGSQAQCGLFVRRQYYFDVRDVSIMRVLDACIDMEAGLVANFTAVTLGDTLDQSPTMRQHPFPIVSIPYGIRARSHNNGSNTWASNLVTWTGCRFHNISRWAMDVDACNDWVLRSCNPEFCGTDGDDSTGIYKFTNSNPSYAQAGLTFVLDGGTWGERNAGFAAVYIGPPAAANGAKTVLIATQIHDDFMPGSLKHGVYIDGTGQYSSRLVTKATTILGCSVGDVTLAGSNALWSQDESDTIGVVNTGNSPPPPPPPPVQNPSTLIWDNQLTAIAGAAVQVQPWNGMIDGHYGIQIPGAQGDKVQGSFALVAGGTYNITFTGFTKNECAIIQVAIDGNAIGSLDWYSSSLTGNVTKTLSGVALTAGSHTLTFEVVGRNASSVAWYWGISRIEVSP